MENIARLADETLDSVKRMQILDGARRCFLAQGFDGSSMNDIVKAAGVSKGTVYAYFPSKERLFEALVFHDRRRQAEEMMAIESQGRLIEDVLTELGLRMVRLFTSPESISWVRTVVAIADKFPDVGRAFFEAGPAYSVKKVTQFLETKIADGTLRAVDPELAAMQFIELVGCCQIKPRLLGGRGVFKDRPMEETVNAAVDLFLGGLRAQNPPH
ncbi:MAG: TetR/AcrR family transcriptional regulator [Aestuariivirga sp.]|jgi:AcrR family transcriptional regulator